MTGLRPAVIGLIASALFSIFLTVFFHSDKISFTSIVPADFISSLIIAVIMTAREMKTVWVPPSTGPDLKDLQDVPGPMPGTEL